MILLLEMACKTKVTLIRAVQEKIKEGQCPKSKGGKEESEKKVDKKGGNEQEGREKGSDDRKEKGGRKDEKGRGVRRG